MARELKLSIGQHSDRGRKESNQDFHGAMIPAEPVLGLKGVAVALADGISSSKVGRIAAESAVGGFLTDYYCTPDSWSVKTSAQRVIAATNSWLDAQTRRSAIDDEHDRDRGHVCTLSAVVVKSRTAHVFHVGDSRVYRVAGQSLEQLTTDHRVVVSSQQTYLGRALGARSQVEIDYQAFELETGDVLVLATDGVYEHVEPRVVAQAIAEGAADLDGAAKRIVETAFERGSPDNLTVQIVRVDALPDGEAAELVAQTELPLPPLLEPGAIFDGYRIVRQLHDSSRSHIYLAVDTEAEAGAPVVLKIPSIDLRDDPAYLRRFAAEEWVARRLDNPHVLNPCPPLRRRNYLYVVTEYVDGRTLSQWMIDNPRPDLEVVRGIVEQIGRGLQAFHRKEMLHQDLRPENVMIDRTGTARIIDFGAARVAGIAESDLSADEPILGTAQYTAPEYFLGENGTTRSDIYSLGVITYQMLTGRLPYGARMAQARTRQQQRRVGYTSVLDDNRPIPAWVDGALRKAVHPEPVRRYEELSEFLYDLRHPDRQPAGCQSGPADGAQSAAVLEGLIGGARGRGAAVARPALRAVPLAKRKDLPDDRLAHAAILELQRGRDLVSCEFLQALGGEIVAARIAEQHQPAGIGVASEPSQCSDRHLALVADIARDHDVSLGCSVGVGEPVVGADLERKPVCLGIEACGNQRKQIDIVGGHRRRTGLRRRHRGDARARGEVDHALAAHRVRMIEQVACDRLAARPAEGPVRRVDVLLFHPGFGRLPDRDVLGGEPQPEFRHHSRPFEGEIGADETFGVDRQARHQKRCAATIAAVRSRPTCAFDLNLAWQSAGLSGLTKAICQAKCSAIAARPA